MVFADGAKVPRLGLALSELTEEETVAVRVFSHRMEAGLWLRRFCLYQEENVLPFLDANSPHWKLLDVQAGGVQRRWHLARIWREHVWEDLPAKEAARAILSGLTPEALLDDLTLRPHHVFLPIESEPLTAKQYARDGALIVTLVEEIAKSGTDPMAILREHAQEVRRRQVAVLAIALLVAARVNGTTLPEAFDPILREALQRETYGAFPALCPEARRRRAGGGRSRARSVMSRSGPRGPSARAQPRCSRRDRSRALRTRAVASGSSTSVRSPHASATR
jgi:hypothetical protein